MKLGFLFVTAFVCQVYCDFTPDFRAFIHNNFGIALVNQLERKDLGADASFGGKASSDEKIQRQAVILVHGITNKISRFFGMVDHLRKRGYTSADPQHWAFVKRRKEVSVFHSVPGSINPSTIIMVGTGLIDGRLEDVMGGLYCETTDELRTAKVLLGYDLKDGSVLNAHERRTPEDPFRFAGIKWFAGRCAWGLLHDRDALTYERMGTTTDARGHELTYHTLQSIKRPEWPSEATPGMLRQHTASCYLYRRHKRTNKTEIFLWGSILKFGSAPEKAIQLGVASTWLNVVHSPRGGRAKNFSALMDEADSHQWLPSSTTCHVCARKPKLGSYPHCAGCHQTVCKDCSEQHHIFHLSKSGRAKKRLFCAMCVKNATGMNHLGHRNNQIEAGYDTSECSTSGTNSMSSSRSSRSDSFFSRTFSFKRPPDPFRPRVSPSDDEAPDELDLDW